MAERTVSVNLVADAARFIRGFDEAVKKTKDSTQTIEQQLAAQERAFTQVGTAATAIGVLALAGVTAAVAAYSQFDSAMSGVQAATHASAEEIDALGDAALDAGQRTVFSATESAAAIENLARAGVTTADILGGALDGSLDLAAAGGLEVADAAEIAASALTQFQLKGSDVAHVADLLAAGAGKAQGGVGELGDALNQSGLVAAQMGLSIEEAVGSLTAFASAGLIGSDAGTSFRAMLLRLANPTKESQQLMDDLGLSVYDAQGNFIGMEALAGQLEDRLGGLTQETRNAALAQIFGQDAIRTSSILYEQGAEGIRDWTAAVDEQGYAAETAAIRLDNLKGDLEALGGAFETLMINLGAGADGPLRGVVQGLTDVVEMLGSLDPAAQAVVLGAMGVVGAVGLVGGGALIAVPKIAEFRTALSALGITANTTKTAMLGLGTAVSGIGLVAGVITVLVDALERTRPAAEEWSRALRDGADAAELLTLANQGFANSADGFDLATDQVGKYLDQLDRMDENGLASFLPENWDVQFTDFESRLRQIDEALGELDPAEARAGFDSLVEEFGLTNTEAADLLDRMPNLAAALEGAGGAADGAAEGVATVGDAAEIAAEQTQALLDASAELTGTWIASNDAAAAFNQQLIDLDRAAAEAAAEGVSLAATWDTTAGTFDLTTQSGIDAHGALSDLVTAANDNQVAMLEAGKGADEMRAAQARARDEIARVAGRFDATGQAAQTYTGLLNAVPDSVITDVAVNTAAAERELDWLTRTRNVLITTSIASDGQRSGFGSGAPQVALARYSGGMIPGYSPGYDDHLGYLAGTGFIGLAGGEWIINPRSSAKHDRLLAAINADALPGFHTGGRAAQPNYSMSVAAPVVNVAPTAVSFPSQMRAQIDLGGVIQDVVMRIVSDVDQEAAYDTRLGRR